MNFVVDDNSPKVEDKNKKASRIILILIIILIVGIVTIMSILPLLKGKKFVIEVNDVEKADLKSIIDIQDDGKIYVPIKEIAEYLGYTSYNGDYINKSEDSTQCYAEANNEVVTFKANSNVIEIINKKTSKSIEYTIDEPVFIKDGKLYITELGMEKAFNTSLSYNKENSKIAIYTMGYIVNAYEKSILALGYKEISKEFDDQKAILYGLVIVKNSSGKYGLLNIETEELLLETKYDKIEFMPEFADFLVESNGKKGIVTNTGKEKIRIIYDNIAVLNKKLKLYVVKANNKYGIIDDAEKEIVPVGCDSIGVSSKDFKDNELTNNIILFEKIIPVKVNDSWALYSVDGTRLTEFLYNGFGCTNHSNNNVSNIVLVPDLKIIIGNKDKKYVLINEEGKELFNGLTFDEAYLIKDYNKTTYYVVRNEKSYNIEELIEAYNKRNNS